MLSSSDLFTVDCFPLMNYAINYSRKKVLNFGSILLFTINCDAGANWRCCWYHCSSCSFCNRGHWWWAPKKNKVLWHWPGGWISTQQTKIFSPTGGRFTSRGEKERGTEREGGRGERGREAPAVHAPAVRAHPPSHYIAFFLLLLRNSFSRLVVSRCSRSDDDCLC